MVTVVEEKFGQCLDRITNKIVEIRCFTISNSKGISVQILTYGATIATLKVPDVDGNVDDITLGYDNIAGYLTESNPYIGGTIGRVCSRIGNAHYMLNGRKIEVSCNFLGKHHLHGGLLGFDKVIWDVDSVRSDGVVLKFLSAEGAEGHPGVVNVLAAFTLNEENVFRFWFEATTTEPTPVNLTNHAYFNLAGHNAGKKGMAEHVVTIRANQITDMDEDTVPNGGIISLDNHPLDLRTQTNVGEGLKKILPAKGYDHNYILDYKPDKIVLQARAYHLGSGRYMDISSNQPCMHFYTSHNMPDVENGDKPTIIGKGGAKYNKHGSFCMETHWYPNAVNIPNFPSIILKPGEKYRHVCNFKFGLRKEMSELTHTEENIPEKM